MSDGQRDSVVKLNVALTALRLEVDDQGIVDDIRSKVNAALRAEYQRGHADGRHQQWKHERNSEAAIATLRGEDG